MGRVAGFIACIFFGIVIVLQLLLAAGVLPVTMAWGGQHTAQSAGLRLASIGAAVILALFAFIISRRASLFNQPSPSLLIKILSWIITAFLAFNTFGNMTSSSIPEKAVFGTITVILTIACLLVSLSKPAKN